MQVSGILYEYLPPNSGISPELPVRRVQEVMNSEAGLTAYLQASMHANQARPEDLVLQLAEVLDAPAPDPREMISRLLEVVENPIALEVYDREMSRRQPREADRWR